MNRVTSHFPSILCMFFAITIIVISHQDYFECARAYKGVLFFSFLNKDFEN
jgi:hypothetical protein